jgi:hypothetical protein
MIRARYRFPQVPLPPLPKEKTIGSFYGFEEL